LSWRERVLTPFASQQVMEKDIIMETKRQDHTKSKLSPYSFQSLLSLFMETNILLSCSAETIHESQVMGIIRRDAD